MTKKLSFLVLLIGIVVSAEAQDKKLQMIVTSIAAGNGSIILEFYDDVEDWLEKPIKVVRLEGKKERESVSVDLPFGKYGVTLFQDQNGNGELDRNFIGIPKEPVGFGNDYRPFGPPKFSSSVIEYSEKIVQHKVEMYEAF